MSGFTLPADSRVTVEAACLDADHTRPLVTRAWILDASTRRPVWEFNGRDAEREDDHLRVLTEEIALPAGAYEVYYASNVDWQGGESPRRSRTAVCR